MRIGLVGCVKEKRSEAAPARELYRSQLFLGRMAWVERTCDRWFILSALHGLVDPGEVLAPYDATLKDMSTGRRREWSQRVLHELEEAVGPLEAHVYEIHAGAEYVEYGLAEGLLRRGAQVERPMQGLRLGEQLAAYAAAMREGTSVPRGRGRAGRDPLPPTGAGSKYEPLRQHLARQTADSVSLRFDELEEILGFPLPPSAARHGAWWQNDHGHSQARSWLDAGFRASADRARRTVTFRRAR